MRPLRLLIPIILILLIAPVAAMATTYVKYSPGPNSIEDGPGNVFYARHAIEYDPISGGVYTRNQRLYVDVANPGDSLSCGYAVILYGGGDSVRYAVTSPLPFTYNNTPYWWYNYYNTNHPWVSGQYITYRAKAGDVFCSAVGTVYAAGWSSSIASNYTWSHQQISW